MTLKTIVCHLGNGASVSAQLTMVNVLIQVHGTSHHLAGLVMGTRSVISILLSLSTYANKEGLDIEAKL
ncbi:MAG: hypothetical protein ACLR78_00930 [Roseburia sp.]